ncbi:MAG: glycosyltransferase family 2 protein [Methylobacter sp.]
MSKLSISIIIVNYNTSQHVISCLDSIFQLNPLPLEVIVVDNASQDDSVHRLQTMYGEKIQLICSSENLGFGRANNLAINHASGEVLLLLNPDTTFVQPDTLLKMQQALYKDINIGLLGPRVFEPRKGKFSEPKYRYPSHGKLNTKKVFKDLPGEIAWILGACMMLKTSIYKMLSGFDPDYFLYGEDVDSCLRLRQLGFRIVHCTDATIIHVAGASEAKEEPYETRLRKERGFYLFCKKHFKPSDFKRITIHCWLEATVKLYIYSFLGIKKDRIIRLSAMQKATSEILFS